MTPAKLRKKPGIGPRLLQFAMLCAILPLSIFGLLTAVTQDSRSFEPVENSISASAGSQLQLGVKANAAQISSRMEQISYSVRQLKHYAQEILGDPAFYGGQIPTGSDDEGNPREIKAPLDNTLYYSHGDDGAIRRLVDDGSPSAFFSSRNFTELDLQRLYASAALENFLSAPCIEESLCGRSFLVTTDDLVRTYPYYNFAHWNGHTKVSKPRDFWSQVKADASGVVWTSPYQSMFDGNWVVACLAQVTIGGHGMGVVGCEVPLKPIAEDLLVFSLGSGGMAWIVKPGMVDEDKGWWTLSTQPGAEDYLRVVPVATAALPTDKHPQSEILIESDMAVHAPDEVTRSLDLLLSGTDQALEFSKNDQERLLSSAQIASTGWVLCGIISNQAKQAASEYSRNLQSSSNRELWMFIASAAFGVLLAFGLASLESRMLCHPLNLLTQLVNKAKHDPNVSITDFSNLGEISDLTSAIKTLHASRLESDPPLVEDADDTPADEAKELPPE